MDSAPVKATGSVEAEPVAHTPSGSVSDTWRTEKIKAIWRALHFGSPPLSDEDANTLQKEGGWKTVDPDAHASTYYISGSPSLAGSPTGMLLAEMDGQYRPYCSVVLIKPDVVLTAAHCVEPLTENAILKVYFPLEGFRTSAPGGALKFCDGRDAKLPACSDDLAAIKLAEPFRFIIPARIAGPAFLIDDGKYSAQGFGTSNPILSDRGVLRAGFVQPGECNCGAPGLASRHLICFPIDYERTDNRIAAFANFAGHSGGGLFSQNDSELLLLGIASMLNRGCDMNDVHEGSYVDLRDVRYAAWLASFYDEVQIAYPRNPLKCLLRKTYALSGDANASSYLVHIPENTESLLVTLNHELNGFPPYPDEDLDVEMPKKLNADCIRHNGAETCEVHNPPPGDYSIGIKAVRGNPAYQLTAVAILE